ncbi:unnamed protein product [Periconia digitata]|uniref:Uncharacterized protein n=1 Tax=Periconia digitata TaxID=1303443 RepID=A0A9W4U7C2_9PLEO|nr:unnamed protein product [Periconia digitata]
MIPSLFALPGFLPSLRTCIPSTTFRKELPDPASLSFLSFFFRFEWRLLFSPVTLLSILLVHRHWLSNLHRLSLISSHSTLVANLHALTYFLSLSLSFSPSLFLSLPLKENGQQLSSKKHPSQLQNKS